MMRALQGFLRRSIIETKGCASSENNLLVLVLNMVAGFDFDFMVGPGRIGEAGRQPYRGGGGNQ